MTIREGVFVSYSHHDAKWLERLQVHMKTLVRDGNVDCWDDTMISPGADWRDEIERALARAKVAVILVSADFLASDFIANEELPLLLEAAERDGAAIIPLLLSPSRYAHIPSLARFQTVNPPDQPLSRLSSWRRDEFLVQATVGIERALVEPPDGPAGDPELPKEPVEAQELPKEPGEAAELPEEPAETSPQRPREAVERVILQAPFTSMGWFHAALDRCRSVARIEDPAETPCATGFLVEGASIHPSFPAVVLITASYVVGDKGALGPDEARVTFRALEGSTGPYRIASVLWSSPPSELNVTIAKLDGMPRGAVGCPVARRPAARRRSAASGLHSRAPDRRSSGHAVHSRQPAPCLGRGLFAVSHSHNARLRRKSRVQQ